MQILSSLKVQDDTREKQILRALLDKNCLAILSTTKENAMTASMICSRCNISLSATHRKLKLLQKLNLLRTTYVMQINGRKSMLFQSKIMRITILLCENQLQIHTNFISSLGR